MRWYRVLFEDTELRECLVMASDEDEARQRVAEGDYDDSSLVETTRTDEPQREAEQWVDALATLNG